MSKELAASGVTSTVQPSERGREWHVDSAEGEPAYYPPEQIGRIVKRTLDVEDKTAEFLKVIATAGTIALAGYILQRIKSS